MQKTITISEYRDNLAADAMRLEKSLGDMFPRAKMAEQLMRTDFQDSADCALDLAVDGMPVADRVRLQLAAQRGGYSRPWGRDEGRRVVQD